MPSPLQLCAKDLSFLSSLSFLYLFLSLNTGVHGATLKKTSLWENEPDIFRSSLQTPPPPSVAMLQALQYIQSLSQQTLPYRVTNDNKPLVPDNNLNDMGHVHAMIQLATPAWTSAGMQNGRREEKDRDGKEKKKEDKGQQWIQAVFSTLQHTVDQMTPMKTPHRATGHSLTPMHQFFLHSPELNKKDRQSGVEGYGRNFWTNQGDRRRHKKIPVMLERGKDQLLKRVNENAEEQYTPQKLATLQSVFEELGQIANSKTFRKQQHNEYGEGDNDNEGNNVYREKKMLFDDVARDDEELMPLEETTEQEEEETQGHKFNGSFDTEDGSFVAKNEEEQVEEESNTDKDDEGKRSEESDLFEMEKIEHPDDTRTLVDYYLMNVLDKADQEKKRDQEKKKEQEEEESNGKEERGEEEEEIERRAPHLQYTVYPQSLYQLLQVSKKLQISPGDILDVLESDLDKAGQRIPAQAQTPSVSYTDSYTQIKPATALYQQPLQMQETRSITQDILRILGLANGAQPKNKSLLRPNQYKPALRLNYDLEEKEHPDYTFSENSRIQHKADYDDTVDEDKLASYLAAEMLAQSPRHDSLVLEQATQDYFDQAGKSVPKKRQEELEDIGENSNEETLLRILNYLNPDSEDTDELDINGKTVPGM